MTVTVRPPTVSVPDNGSLPRIGVAMLIHRFYPHVGGAETQLKALTPRLIERGIDVHVLTRPEPGAPRREIIDGAHVYRVPISDARGLASLGYTLGAARHLWH